MTYDLLDGVTVVELAMYAFAPSCGAVLADWGADVVKVVLPTVADPMKGTPVAALPAKDVDLDGHPHRVGTAPYRARSRLPHTAILVRCTSGQM